MTVPVTTTNRYVIQNGITAHKYGDPSRQAINYDGYVGTFHGYVVVNSHQWSDGTSYTELQFIHDGVCYVRRWQRQFKPRHMLTLAHRFASYVIDGFEVQP